MIGESIRELRETNDTDMRQYETFKQDPLYGRQVFRTGKFWMRIGWIANK